MGRRIITQVKSFWFDSTLELSKEMDQKVNQFLSSTPGILTNVDYLPEIVWSEVGHYIVCYVTYQIMNPPKRSRQSK
jgi:hypothetical protein